MSRLRLITTVLLAGSFLSATAAAQQPAVDRLSQQLGVLDADPELGAMAAYERLQARQAVQALAEARSSQRDSALYVAERRVQVAEVAARTQAMQRELARLDRERSELLVEASQRDAARARAEAERLRIQAQIQAEEAARLRQQAEADAAVMQDVDAALTGVAGAQTARLSAAREREAALARQEAELVAGGKLPPSSRDGRGEIFSLGGDAFASGQANLTAAAAAAIRTLAIYLQTGPSVDVRVEGHTDSQGAAAANLQLSERRAAAVREALVAGGLKAGRVNAVGLGASRPVADNANPAGRARNRRVEIIVSPD